MDRLFKVVSICTAMSFLVACDQKSVEQESEQLRPVRTFVVGTSDSVSERSFPGVVDANQKATLSFRVSGKLSELAAREGMFVKTGQLLARLDDQDFKIELADAKAGYARANADFERASLLVKKGHVSKSDFDKLKATQASAAAHLASIKQKLQYSSLKAPFDGQIAKRYLENYQDVSASQPIYLLQDLSKLEVTVDLPASVMVSAEKERSSLQISASFEDVPNQRFPLEIKEVATVADDITQTYSVALSMTAVEGFTILPGMTATVTAETPKDLADVASFVVPSHSIVGNGTNAYLWIVTPDQLGTGIVKKNPVTVGEARKDGLEVLSGINDGQLVITAGMTKLRDGQKVRLPKGLSK